MSANASFSIVAHLLSVGVSDLDMSVIGLQVELGCFCISTPPNPYDEVSVAMFVSLFGSYKATTGLPINAVLISSNALACTGPHNHVQSFFNSSHRGLVLSAK